MIPTMKPEAGMKETRTYSYDKAPDIRLTFAIGVYRRGGRLRFYPLSHPQNEKPVGGPDGFASVEEAFNWHLARLNEPFTFIPNV